MMFWNHLELNILSRIKLSVDKVELVVITIKIWEDFDENLEGENRNSVLLNERLLLIFLNKSSIHIDGLQQTNYVQFIIRESDSFCPTQRVHERVNIIIIRGWMGLEFSLGSSSWGTWPDGEIHQEWKKRYVVYHLHEHRQRRHLRRRGRRSDERRRWRRWAEVRPVFNLTPWSGFPWTATNDAAIQSLFR